MGPQDTLDSSGLLPFWTKEKEAGIWDFKGKAGNLQADEKE